MKSTKLFLLVVLFLASCAAPATSKPMPTQTFTPEPTATQTSIPTPTITPAPTQVGGGSGRFIFTYRKDEFLAAFPDLKGETNVFVANIDGTNLTPITNGLEGNNYLRDVSPDGTKVLITSTSDSKNKDAILYLVNLNSLNSEPIKLAEGLPNNYGNNPTAKWIDDTLIIYIGKSESGFGIYKINADGNNPINIYKYNNDGEGNKPFEILAVDVNNARIYWDTLIDRVEGGNRHFTKYYIWYSSLNGGERTALEFNGNQVSFTNVFGRDVVLSPDGTKIAWVEEATPTFHHNYLHIASISDINNPNTLKEDTLTSMLIMNWYSDASKLLVFDLGSAWEIFGPPEDPASDLYGIYEVSTSPDLTIRNFHLPKEVMAEPNSYYMDLYDISPDGRQIICAIYEKNADGNFEPKINFLNLETLTFSEVSGFTFTNTAINGIHWIP